MATKVVDKGWKNIIKATRALDDTSLVIGVPSNARYPDGTSVALVGAAHEYGLGGLPQRAWLTKIFEASRQDLLKVSVDLARAKSPVLLIKQLKSTALKLTPLMKQRFDQLQLAPLDPATIESKGNAKVLADTDRLRDSITVWKEDTKNVAR